MPEGFDYIAQDKDGMWFAFTHEPIRSDGDWVLRYGDTETGEWEFLGGGDENPNWRNTLEKRPLNNN